MLIKYNWEKKLQNRSLGKMKLKSNSGSNRDFVALSKGET